MSETTHLSTSGVKRFRRRVKKRKAIKSAGKSVRKLKLAESARTIKPVSAKQLPPYLKRYVAKQDYAQYTPIDQACWRFIMRLSRSFFKKHSVSIYLDGLKKTGIPIERIPRVDEMNKLLSKFGWGAVPVRGFIPPGIFMEFQARHILPISCDMRTLEHLNYTPAPDIVHEAAGHAPIIADPSYSHYLKQYATVAFRAIRSAYDMKLYEAIRYLSDVKEAKGVSQDMINQAEARLQRVVDEEKSQEPSEAALLARMNWWTVEYGLVGSLADPKIYGAGLLSSIGESYDCLREGVRKIPFTINNIEYAYDITRPQPQLFIAESFEQLTDVLEQFANTMTFRVGGYKALVKAKKSEMVNTIILDSGLQIDGVLMEILGDASERVDFIRFLGPVQLCYQGKVLKNQTMKQHPHGFSTPLGKLQFEGRVPLWMLDKATLKKRGIERGRTITLSFESGIEVKGKVQELLWAEGKLIVVRFTQCTVRRGETVFFDPTWGTFDLAVGEKVTSVCAGPADRTRYPVKEDAAPTVDFEMIKRSNAIKKRHPLNSVYGEIRKLRESKSGKNLSKKLRALFQSIVDVDPNDWLASLEILELVVQKGLDADFEKLLYTHLEGCQRNQPQFAVTIQRGINEVTVP